MGAGVRVGGVVAVVDGYEAFGVMFATLTLTLQQALDACKPSLAHCSVSPAHARPSNPLTAGGGVGDKGHTAPEVNRIGLCMGKAHCGQGDQWTSRLGRGLALANLVWHPYPFARPLFVWRPQPLSLYSIFFNIVLLLLLYFFGGGSDQDELA